MKTIIAILMLSFVSAVAPAQTVDESLERLLTTEQKEAIDLKKMTAAQKEALFDALATAYAVGRERGREEAPKPTPSVPQRPSGGGSVIETKIDGTFEGWEGETIIKLTNGQIWQQTEYYYHYHYAFRPDVLIYSSGNGYKMKVEGVEKAVGVRQLR